MTFSIDLPPPVDTELAIEAEREGLSASEQATLLVLLATALKGEARKTPFRSVVRSFLKQNGLDADHLAEVCEGLIALCLHRPDKASVPLDQTLSESSGPMDSEGARSLFREWRNSAVHRSINDDLDVSLVELPPLEQLIQPMGRMRRPSALGKYAWIGVSSEDHAADKQREIAREDRG